jgi:hypothetical protein
VATCVDPANSLNSRSMVNRLGSERSTITSLRGLNDSNCRQISDPMLPPAPVTRTTLSVTTARTVFSSS